MATPNTLRSSASSPADVIVQQQIELAAERAQTIGDLQNNVREQVDAMAAHETPASAEAAEAVKDITLEQREEVKVLMEEKAKELEYVGEEYKDVALTDDLPDGVLGQTQLESPDAAVVRKELALDPEELKRTAMHESDTEVGHASQVAPKVPNHDAALIVDGERFDSTTVIEGDVEQGVAQKMDGNRRVHREGQPEKEYREGQVLANAVIDRVGEDVWKNAIKKSGNPGEIQKALWEDRVRTSSDIHTLMNIADEAQETGYEKEAGEVIAGMAA